MCGREGCWLITSEVFPEVKQSRYITNDLDFLILQIHEHKFMVTVNASSQGKFKESSTQATHLYDIISYTDALRHSLYPGDKVLAPRLPEGESFAPATVLEGHEDRSIQGEDLADCFCFEVSLFDFMEDHGMVSCKRNITPLLIHWNYVSDVKPSKLPTHTPIWFCLNSYSSCGHRMIHETALDWTFQTKSEINDCVSLEM